MSKAEKTIKTGFEKNSINFSAETTVKQAYSGLDWHIWDMIDVQNPTVHKSIIFINRILKKRKRKTSGGSF